MKSPIIALIAGFLFCANVHAEEVLMISPGSRLTISPQGNDVTVACSPTGEKAGIKLDYCYCESFKYADQTFWAIKRKREFVDGTTLVDLLRDFNATQVVNGPACNDELAKHPLCHK